MSPAVVSGLVSAGSSVLGNLFNWWQNDEQREYERQQSDRQWRLALEQWNRENQYNLPSAQMERLRAAGINPHLAFANGDILNEGAASPSVPDAHQVQPYTVDPLEASAIAVNTAQAAKLTADAKKSDADTTGVQLDNFFKSFNKSVVEANEDEIRDAAVAEVRAGSVSSELQYYQSVFAAYEVASLIYDLSDHEVEMNGVKYKTTPLGNRPVRKDVAGRLERLGLSGVEQRELERDLYRSFVKAQKSINETAGTEASVDRILPELIAKAPDWLQPILVIVNRWLVDGKMPSMVFRPSNRTDYHEHFDYSERKTTVINKAY